MNIIKQHPIVSTVVYWLLVTAIAIVPGHAVYDFVFMVIMLFGIIVYVLAVRKYYKKQLFKLVGVVVVTAVFASVILPHVILKQIHVQEPANPFAELDGGTGMASYQTHILSWRFWLPGFVEQQHLKNIPRARLIKFSQNDLNERIKGIDEATIIDAFGRPAAKRIDREFVVWEYYPWVNHSDWVMPVYVKDGLLWQIGD